jgi:hypothetical protein
VHEEGKNLKKKGNVYRVANATAKKFPHASTLPHPNKSVRFHEPDYHGIPGSLDLQNGNFNSVNSAEVIVNPHLCSPNGSLREGTDTGFVISNGFRPMSPNRGTGTMPLIKGNYKIKDGSFV